MKEKRGTHAGVVAIMAAVLTGVSVWGAPPDLTAPGAYTDTTYTWNLGPTGCRGWMYNEGNEWMFEPEKLSSQSRQILITHVEPGSPAWGVLTTNDVILGLGATLFTNDARKSFGWAIGEAEKTENAGKLKLKVWRKGVTTDNVTLTLAVMGAYSDTAPYNCQKSAKILANACTYMEAQPIDCGTEGGAAIGLALLATGNKEYLPKVQAYARRNAPQDLKLTIPVNQMVAWPWGYNNLFLAEYYLITGDKEVLHALTEYTVTLAKGQSVFGTYGHGMAWSKSDRSSTHGYVPVYGALNQAGLVCNLSMVMGKKCGVKDPEVEQAIARGRKFYGRYAGQGTIPYGEGNPEELHEDNGKNATTALLMALQDQADMTTQAKWFAKMCTAGYALREFGHTGPGFCTLWQSLGANVGGPAAMAAHFKQIRWHLDLLRRWDGTFVYDAAAGGTPGREYLGKNSATAFYMLTYAAPLQKLYITGKNANKALWLSPADVNEAIADGRCTLKLALAGMPSAELVGALASWSPQKRKMAATELGKRANAAELVSRVIALAEGTNAAARMGACQALGALKDVHALPVLVRRLSDSDSYVRFLAGEALLALGPQARPALNDMLSTIIARAQPIEPLNWDDPAQVAYGALGSAVFRGQLASSVEGVDKKLLYPAIAAMSRAYPRAGALNGLLEGSALSVEDVKALAPVLSKMLMTGHEICDCNSPQAVIRLLSKHNVEEGIAAAMLFRNIESGRGWFPYGAAVSMEALQKYRSAARATLPELYQWNTNAGINNLGMQPGAFSATIAALENDLNPPPALLCFKTIHAASAKPTALTAPASTTVLRASASDIDGGSLTYTWSKVRGRGPVTFTPNGTAASSNSSAKFTVPGTYVLKVTVSDASLGDGSTGYGGVSSNVMVRFGMAVNQPPVAKPQSVTLAEDTSRAITLTGTDPEGYELVFTRTSSPAHGSMAGNVPNLTYTPEANWHGEDSLTFTVTDSDGIVSPPATVKLVVSPMNDQPVALYRSLPVPLNTAVDIPLTASDIDGDPLKMTVLTRPAHGTLSGTPPKLTYKPAAGYKGVDSCTFKVNDGKVDSEPATVTLSMGDVTKGVFSEFYQWAGLASPEPWPDMASRKPDTTRVDAKMQISGSGFPPNYEDHFCSRHTAYLKVATEGDYTFSTSADDNTKVWVDGKLAVVQVYSRPGWNIGALHLTPGYHGIRLEFMESYGANYFTLLWSGPGFGQQEVPENVFFRQQE